MVGKRRLLFVAGVCWSLAFALSLSSQDRARTILTIYSDNLGVVRDSKSFSLQKGVNEIKLIDLLRSWILPVYGSNQSEAARSALRNRILCTTW